MEYKQIVDNWKLNQIIDESDIDYVLDNFKILFAYNSNKMENIETTYHNTREIFENGKVVNFTGGLRTIYEIQNQKICYDKLKQKIVNKEPITPELIKFIHRHLMHNCIDEFRYAKGERAGQFKIGNYVVGDNVGVDSEFVEQEITDLCNEVNNYKGDDILLVASYLHLIFESIHPFSDGNGRVGRTLMNYYLMVNNHPPTVIYEEDKEAYYLALTIFDKTRKLDGFKKFLEEQTVKTWGKRTNVKSFLGDYNK